MLYVEQFLYNISNTFSFFIHQHIINISIYIGVQVPILNLIIQNDLQTIEILFDTFYLLPNRASLKHELEIKFGDWCAECINFTNRMCSCSLISLSSAM